MSDQELLTDSQATIQEVEQITPSPIQPPGIEPQQTSILILDHQDIPSSFEPRKSKPRKPRGQTVDWSAEMTTVLVRELVQAIRSGKRSDNGFKMEVWNSVSEAVCAIAGKEIPLTGEKCQAKLENLKRKWKVWIRLKEMSGFGYDTLTGAVTAPDDVWETEIQEQPAIREFRDRPIGNIAELGEIFEGVQATGRHAIYPRFGQTESITIDSPSPTTLSHGIDSDDASSASSPSQTKR